MNYHDVLAFYKTQQAAADALGIEQASISKWQNKRVPHLRQLQLEKLTKGALKAEKSILQIKKSKRMRVSEQSIDAI